MQEDGSFYLGKNEGGKTNFGTMTISFFINPDGKLRVEYSKTTDGQNTSIVFTYSKK